MKIVLDSNILISSLGKRSVFRPIWDSFINGSYQIVVSEDIIKEYEEIMLQHSAPGVAEIILAILVESPNVSLQKVFYNWKAILADPDDNKFFDLAVAADVDYLVTNDRHFEIAKKLNFPRITIINSDEFLQIISKT